MAKCAKKLKFKNQFHYFFVVVVDEKKNVKYKKKTPYYKQHLTGKSNKQFFKS
jgi:hypothetical protein